MRRGFALGLVLCGLALAAAPGAAARQARYCEKPNGPGGFLAASDGVGCATAERVKNTLLSRACRERRRCVAAGFRCVAVWDGSFDLTFSDASHALCNSGWRWIEWDGG